MPTIVDVRRDVVIMASHGHIHIHVYARARARMRMRMIMSALMIIS